MKKIVEVYDITKPIRIKRYTIFEKKKGRLDGEVYFTIGGNEMFSYFRLNSRGVFLSEITSISYGGSRDFEPALEYVIADKLCDVLFQDVKSRFRETPEEGLNG